MSRIEQLEGELRAKQEELSILHSFTEHAGAKLLEAYAKEQRNARLLLLAEPSNGFGSILQTEFMKGEASGIGLVMKFAEIRVEILRSEVKILETGVQLEKEHEIATATSVGRRSRVDNDDDWRGGDELDPGTSG